MLGRFAPSPTSWGKAPSGQGFFFASRQTLFNLRRVDVYACALGRSFSPRLVESDEYQNPSLFALEYYRCLSASGGVLVVFCAMCYSFVVTKDSPLGYPCFDLLDRRLGVGHGRGGGDGLVGRCGVGLRHDSLQAAEVDCVGHAARELGQVDVQRDGLLGPHRELTCRVLAGAGGGAVGDDADAQAALGHVVLDVERAHGHHGALGVFLGEQARGLAHDVELSAGALLGVGLVAGGLEAVLVEGDLGPALGVGLLGVELQTNLGVGDGGECDERNDEWGHVFSLMGLKLPGRRLNVS